MVWMILFCGLMLVIPILSTTLTTVGGLFAMMFGGSLFKGMATKQMLQLALMICFGRS
jgi:hypothetical protein